MFSGLRFTTVTLWSKTVAVKFKIVALRSKTVALRFGQ